MFIFFTAFATLFYYPIEAVEPTNDTFYYFAYGGNILQRRIHVNMPTAEFVSTARLDTHRLDFTQYSDTWGGAMTTIVEDEDRHVWGALWILDIDEIENLDKQELVHLGWYFPRNVTVTTKDGKKMRARTYQNTKNPSKAKGDLPTERRPSSTYLQVIALGAIEAEIPSYNIRYLFSFPTNGGPAIEPVRKELGYPF